MAYLTSLDMLFEEGLSNVYARHTRLAEGCAALLGPGGCPWLPKF